MTLFSASELEQAVGHPVTPEQAMLAERVVSGWLRAATGLPQWPSPQPEQLFAWAIELGGIFHENPTGLAQDQAGSSTQVFGLARRREILDAARSWAASLPGAVGGSPGAPRGSFPPALPWPDPAERPPRYLSAASWP